jgi:hypothetical protein
MPIFVPPPMRRTRRCKRCRLHYPRSLEHCPHCSDVPDNQLEDLRQRVGEAHAGNARLGRWLLIAAIVLLVVLLIA